MTPSKKSKTKIYNIYTAEMKRGSVGEVRGIDMKGFKKATK
jgi:hypothetical protein